MFIPLCACINWFDEHKTCGIYTLCGFSIWIRHDASCQFPVHWQWLTQTEIENVWQDADWISTRWRSSNHYICLHTDSQRSSVITMKRCNASWNKKGKCGELWFVEWVMVWCTYTLCQHYEASNYFIKPVYHSNLSNIMMFSSLTTCSQ